MPMIYVQHLLVGSESSLVNLLWSGAAIWRYRSVSIFGQIPVILAWRHQTIAKISVDFSSVRFYGIQLRAISQWVPKLLLWNVSKTEDFLMGLLVMARQSIRLPLVPHICIGEMCQHCFRKWRAACSAPSHYPNQSWVIINWTLWNKIWWNLNRNKKMFILENASENVVCEIAAILCRVRGDKS